MLNSNLSSPVAICAHKLTTNCVFLILDCKVSSFSETPAKLINISARRQLSY